MRSTEAAVRVWDRGVRLLHWSLVGTVATAWATGDAASLAHEAVGYATLAIVAARLAWSARGAPSSRFSTFVRAPRATLAYARTWWAGAEPRHLGHNPLGGWMIVALLAAVAACASTGALYATDALWGYKWLAVLHEASAWTVLALAALHVAGVAHASWRHGENLVAAMWHGRKRAAGKGDVDEGIK